MKPTITKTKVLNSLILLNLVFNPQSRASVGILNTCMPFYQNSSVRSSSYDSIANNFHKPFVIQIAADRPIDSINNHSKIIELPSENPFLISDLKVNPITANLNRIFSQRTANKQKQIDDKLTSELGAQMGMGFKDKKGDPFHVRVNGMPMSISESQFNSTVKGIEPVLQKMRRILQIYLSNPNASSKDYEFKYLSNEEVQFIIEAIKTSPYLDYALANESLKDYAFGSVFGIDATFGKLTEHLSHIFEINAGTPSGFSNMTMILEAIRLHDPNLYKAIVGDIKENKAFSTLKNIIDGHGKKLIEDGISVQLGVGIYAGAHPDMAMISYFSGMPLVMRKDLFIDRDGYIRLAAKQPINDGHYNINGKKVKHVGSKDYEGYVQVWSIYSRAEESFALQEQTSLTRNGIGFKTPEAHKINQELNKKLGLNLISGSAYKYIFNNKGIAINVVKDNKNNPVLDDFYDQFSQDPIDSHNHTRSLITSIHNKKVYLSNLGTRLIDHKGILSLVTKEAQMEALANKKDPKKTIVSPPQELRTTEEREAFFKNPERYIVKVPDESGGVGVYILPTSTKEAIDEVVQKVRENPQHYVIQNIADFKSVAAVSSVNGANKWVTRANDGRIFIFLDVNGKAVSDPMAILVRVADYLKLSTNTSQKAQYGAILVKQDKKVNNSNDSVDITKSSLPISPLDILTSDQLYHLKDYLISANMIKNGSFKKTDKSAFLNNFWNSARTLMSVLGPDFSYVVDLIEQAKNGTLSDLTLKNKMEELIKKLKEIKTNPKIKSILEQQLSENIV